MSKKKFRLYTFIISALGLALYYFYPANKLPAHTKIDSILVLKSKRELQAFSKGKLVKTYTIALGGNPVGDKAFEGDRKTPEGVYFINAKNPYSGYHKNLGISYPNKSDVAAAKRLGKPAGGDIKIHGIRNKLGAIGKFQRWFDWTNGCMALTNQEVDELYRAVPIGTRIEIRP